VHSMLTGNLLKASPPAQRSGLLGSFPIVTQTPGTGGWPDTPAPVPPGPGYRALLSGFALASDPLPAPSFPPAHIVSTQATAWIGFPSKTAAVPGASES